MKYNIDLLTTYNFKTYSPAILGATISMARVVSIVGYKDAMREMDVNSIHAQVLSELPAGTPKDASKLIYLKLETNTSATTFLAMDWISQQPEVADKITRDVRFTNILPSDVAKIKALLRSGGYTTFEFL
jgi:hypothetical protein